MRRPWICNLVIRGGMCDDRPVFRHSLKLTHLASALFITLTVVGMQAVEFGDRPQTPLERVRQGGVLNVGYALEPPFAFIDEDGRVTGEAPEVFRVAVKALGGAEPRWVYADFGTLIHELEAGRVDVIAAGLFITPERRRRVLFSRPTAWVCPALLVAVGNPGGIVDHAALAAGGHRLGVIAGAAEAADAQAAGIAADHVFAFPDLPGALAALRAGEVDAFALSAVSLRHLVVTGRADGLELVTLRPQRGSRGLAPGQPAFAFRVADAALRDAIDGALEAYLGSAGHAALVGRFGFGAAELARVDDAPECGR